VRGPTLTAILNSIVVGVSALVTTSKKASILSSLLSKSRKVMMQKFLPDNKVINYTLCLKKTVPVLFF